MVLFVSVSRRKVEKTRFPITRLGIVFPQGIRNLYSDE